MSLHDFIPKKVNNKVVLGVYDSFRRIDRIHHSNNVIKNNHEYNKQNIKGHNIVSRKYKYIEDQHNYKDIKYGCVTVSYAGCEVISVYNTYVYYFGQAIVSLPELLSYFENDGMTLNGAFGTSPIVLERYLNSHGFKATFLDGKDMISRCEGENCIILTFFNNEDNIMDAVHTVCVTKEEGGYYGHNVYCNGKRLGPYTSINNFIKDINKGKSKLINSIIVK